MLNVTSPEKPSMEVTVTSITASAGVQTLCHAGDTSAVKLGAVSIVLLSDERPMPLLGTARVGDVLLKIKVHSSTSVPIGKYFCFI